ncbi:hypothetical protein B0J15DRAFT_560369 [Fusarium solani]|uniref:Uncharacterized protein n=1 Tax=Fusarium solani TaxID=169388 RepID=A0A9P9H9V6_FUSSL|nr:uncharacterized protein B0J15DRAFT_560369 [Fusarium solani]KAH7253220.1 hypothetical protein B0J15DRAFT_560369 [Fusarium solani]
MSSLPEHPKPFPRGSAEEIPGYPSARARYVPATVFGVETSSFDYNSPLPTANPDLTVWVLMHAINGCSSKVIKLLSEGRPVRQLELRTKVDSRSLKPIPYNINLRNSQNCDAMIRHLYGEELDEEDQCAKCKDSKGALIGCVVCPDIVPNCANSRRRAKRRPAPESESEAQEEEDTNNFWEVFNDMDPATLTRLSVVLSEAAKRTGRR